jgi:hypothetical protein
MDGETRKELERLIEKWSIHLKESGEGITWSGLPDKRTLCHIKMHTDEIIEILCEQKSG